MILETKRVTLRPFVESDFNAVHEYASDIENVHFMIFGPNSEEQTTDFINRTIEKNKQDPRIAYDFAVVLKETGDVIGGCGIYQNDEQNCGDIGWILN